MKIKKFLTAFFSIAIYAGIFVLATKIYGIMPKAIATVVAGVIFGIGGILMYKTIPKKNRLLHSFIAIACLVIVKQQIVDKFFPEAIETPLTLSFILFFIGVVMVILPYLIYQVLKER